MDFEEILANVTDKLERYTNTASDYVNSRVDQVSGVITEKLQEYPWLPEWVVPKPPPPPPPPAVLETMTRWERAQDWIMRHKLLVAAIALGTGYASYRVYRKSMLLGKTRKAMRAKTGGRCEVVIIAGSPTLPLTRCLALDLERKGFIVFVVCNTIEEEMMVQNLSRPDVRPLSIDIKDPAHCSSSIERFAHFMHTAHSAVPKVKPTYLNLTSVILIPSLSYETSPIATIPRSSFSDLFNTHLLNPILVVQAFLPLLTAQLNPFSKTHPPKVLVFTPSIVSSINPPFHAPESTVCSALSAFTDVLGAELSPLNIPVTQFQLGTFDFTGFSPAMARSGAPSTASTGFHPHTATSIPQALPAPELEALPWPDDAKTAYGSNFVASAASSISAGRLGSFRGSSLRDLHNAVFDVLDGSEKATVIRIGLGADIYGFVGRWVPRGLVSWMMGVRRVEELHAWQGDGGETEEEDDEEEDTEEEGEEEESAAAGSTFVNVDGEHNANVWREGSV